MKKPLIVIGVAVVASTLIQAGAHQKTGGLAARWARIAFEKSVEVRLAERRSQCINAVGSPAFCECLNSNLPISVDFQRYITVTTTSREEYGYEKLTPEDKRITDTIIATRDRCVARVFQTPK